MMVIKMILSIILPLLYDYLDNPFELKTSCRHFYSKEYKLTLLLNEKINPKILQNNNFKKVILNKSNIEDDDMKYLSATDEIMILYNNDNITSVGLNYLDKVKKLYILTNSYSITNKCLKNYKMMEVLDIECDFFSIHASSTIGLDLVTDIGLKYLDNIRKLRLPRNCYITDDGLKYISNVEFLSLCDNPNITDNGLKYLTNIKELDLLTNCNITTNGLKYIKGCKFSNYKLGYMNQIVF